MVVNITFHKGWDDAMRWYKSSLGKKFLMAITGLAMVGFVFAHMAGNLTILWGADGLNAYAEHLRAFPPLLYAFRAVMVVAFLLHLYLGFSLYLENKAARPVAYFQKKNLRATFSSENMIWTGILLGSFAIYHLLHFTLHAMNPEFNQMVDVAGRFDVYQMVVVSFQKFSVALLYVAAMVVLLLHLRHGIQSFFQSLGLTNDATLPLLTTGGRWVAGLVAIGFLVAPVLVYFGALNL